MAAPEKICQKIIDDLVHYISRGVAIKYATAASGIDESTYYAWIKKGKRGDDENPLYEEFSKRIADCQAEFIREAIENIKKAGATRKNWQANTWLLEKLYAGGYGKDSMEVMQLARDMDEIKRILGAELDPGNKHTVTQVEGDEQ